MQLKMLKEAGLVEQMKYLYSSHGRGDLGSLVRSSDLYDRRSRWFRRLVAEATQRYMLRATVRLAAFYCSTKKRRVQSAVRAHAGVKCPYVGVTAGRLRKGQPASTVTLTLGCVRPAGLPRETFTFSDLYCTKAK